MQDAHASGGDYTFPLSAPAIATKGVSEIRPVPGSALSQAAIRSTSVLHLGTECMIGCAVF
ncbi:hypothetical protein D7027_15440 [Ochrobactrum intermedium]|nr:hypothetical protein [Brucella intermedia]